MKKKTIITPKDIMKKKMLDDKILGPLVDKTFEEFDKNRSGYLEKEEFTPLLKDIHKTLHLPPPSELVVEKELKKLDHDKDGRLSKEEYTELIEDLISYTIELL